MKVTRNPQRSRTETFPRLVRAYGGSARLSVATDVGVQTILAAGRGVLPGRLAMKALAEELSRTPDELREAIQASKGWSKS